MLFPCSDQEAAKWITTGVEHWWNLVTLGPPGFAAYARLRFIPDPVYEGQSENDAARRYDALSDNDQLRIVVGALLQPTGLPAEGYLLLWNGWGGDSFPEDVLLTPQVVVPNREYYLCGVSLQDFVSGAVEDWWQARTGHTMPHPAFIWPSDQSWCVTSDIDPHWAGIGSEQALIDTLLTEPRLDVVRVEANQKLPYYH